jgi:hypothetical protein
MKDTVFWDLTRYSLVEILYRFGGTYCLNIQFGSIIITVEMKYTYFSGAKFLLERIHFHGHSQIAPVHTSLPLSNIRFDIVLPFYSQQALPSGLSNQNPV